MKVALAFLLMTSLVGLSYQMRLIWPAPWAPRAHLVPLYYADGSPADNQFAMDFAENKFGGLTNAVQPLFTVTKTTVLTSTVVLATPVVSECIPTDQLGYDTSSSRITTACSDARRRRDIEADDSINPSITAQVEATSRLPIVNEFTPEIESSQTGESWPSDVAPKRNFLGFSLTKTVLVTAIETAYAYTPFVQLKPVTIAAANGLSCVPAGYTVCA